MIRLKPISNGEEGKRMKLITLITLIFNQNFPQIYNLKNIHK